MPVVLPLRPLRRFLAVGIGVLGLSALLTAPALSAAASLGSVPVVVSDYVASGQLQARLEQVYGPGRKAGSGVDFDATTKPGPVTRVYAWTDDRYAHADSDHPIQLTNYWTVPITIADRPIGVAAVWINPSSDQPELAEFTKSAPLATALSAVPADAALVHDGAAAAWYAVAKDTATPLVAGRSGVTKPTPVEDLALARATAAAPPSSSTNGVGLAVGVLVLLVIVIVGTVLLPRFLGDGRRPRRAPAVGTGTVSEPVAEPTPEPIPMPRPKPATEPEPAAKPPAPRASTPRSTSTPPPRAAAAKPRTPVTQKPAVSKPTGTSPTGSRQAASKPRAAKPPASKPPTPRARPPRPPKDETPEPPQA
ncbi:hypothetical protein [Pseudolysinimonas sp.]|uniref:hypothetical protein n=1 Tax=Pseudolysinimonas sp. TaxID=2680009 RepID=UPI003F7EB8B0